MCYVEMWHYYSGKMQLSYVRHITIELPHCEFEPGLRCISSQNQRKKKSPTEIPVCAVNFNLNNVA